jgi:hypothetical protein
MKTCCRRPIALFALVATGACQADPGGDWLHARLAEAGTMASTWGIAPPVVVDSDMNYVEVASDGRLFLGRPLGTRLMARPDAEALGRFLMLHELRHVYQRQQSRQAGALAQECDADYFAVLQIARTQLAKATAADRNDVVAAVLKGQSVGVQANALAISAPSGAHLSNSQRLTVGGFATWRAINEWLRDSGAGNTKAYKEVQLRSQGFVQPVAEDVDTWARSFCRAVGGQDAGNLRSISVMPGTGDMIADSPDGIAYIQQTLDVKNTGDRPMTYQTWPVLGLQVKDDPSYAGAALMSASRLDVPVPAHGEAHPTYRVYFPHRMPDDMAIFHWNMELFPELTALAVPAGDRVEPASCARSWHDLPDLQTNAFYQYLRRAGGVASRQFEGMVGEPKYAFVEAAGMPQYMTWAALPAQALPDDSFIVKNSGARPVGVLGLARGTDRAAVQAVFDAHVRAAKAVCGTADGIVSQRVDNDGDQWLELSHLTVFSTARMLFRTIQDRGHPAAPPTYSVTWWVEGQE